LDYLRRASSNSALVVSTPIDLATVTALLCRGMMPVIESSVAYDAGNILVHKESHGGRWQTAVAEATGIPRNGRGAAEAGSNSRQVLTMNAVACLDRSIRVDSDSTWQPLYGSPLSRNVVV
jgi:hypothetical protein